MSGHIYGLKMLANPILSVSVLLRHYSFDARGNAIEVVARLWLAEYPAKWVIAAIIESIYQGRYKTSSVDNILSLWQREGRPQHHFDIDFADLICGKLLKNIPQEETLPNEDVQLLEESQITPIEPPSFYNGKYSDYVNPEEDNYDFIPASSMDLMSSEMEEFNIPNYGIGKNLKLIRKLN